MSRANRIKTAVAGLLILAGVLFAVLPKDWIEETFHVEPDAGSGVLEVAFALVPVAVGLLLLANAYVSHRRQREAGSTATER
jgi:hypothetical protein